MIPQTRLAVAALFALAVACSEGPAAQPVPFSLDGIWDFTGSAPGPYNSTCADSGSISFVQQGGTVSGAVEFAGSCAFPSGGGLATHEIDSLSGSVKGSVVTFVLRAIPGDSLLCSDTVTVNPTGTAFSGRGTCGPAGRAALAAFRAVPIATVVMTPDSGAVLVGLSRTFTVDLRTASGMHAFLRPVVWATANAAVVTITQGGLVTSVGVGTTTITVTVEGHAATGYVTVPATGLLAVGTGEGNSCALSVTGEVFCWGWGPSAYIYGYGSSPNATGWGVRFVQLAVGHLGGCGRTAGGVAWCWGNGAFGQTNVLNQQVGHVFVSLTVGAKHACGLTAAGAAWCWGSDAYGQLGDNGVSGQSVVPVAVAGGITFQSLSAGSTHTCGIATSGTLYCWGSNGDGRLGDGTTTYRNAPVAVKGGLLWSRVSGGWSYSCGLSTAGAAYCWGYGSADTLGTGGATDSVPAPVLGGHLFTAITTAWRHTCALDPAGAAWCWGTNEYGQIGNGSSGAAVSMPTRVVGGFTFSSISAGSPPAIGYDPGEHTCAVSTSGTTYCWGRNDMGQLGLGQSGLLPVTVPTKVAGQQ